MTNIALLLTQAHSPGNEIWSNMHCKEVREFWAIPSFS